LWYFGPRMSPWNVRLTTGLISGLLVVAAIFALPSWAFFAVCLAAFTGAAAEMVRLVRHWVPGAPMAALLGWVPLVSVGLVWGLRLDLAERGHPVTWMLAAGAFVVGCAALGPLFLRTPIAHAALATGFLAFAIPYFVVPTVSLYVLHRRDPALVLLLVAAVALGDSAAYLVGSRIGRHRLAPVVSPKKSWEGAVAGFLTALAVAAAWCGLYGAELRPGLLAVVAASSVAAQLGDLVESLFKRGAGIKDSSNLLPGHGGLYDRVDAILFAAPVFLLGLWILGPGAVAGPP